MVEALYIAATQDREVAVATYLKTELAQAPSPSIVSNTNLT